MAQVAYSGLDVGTTLAASDKLAWLDISDLTQSANGSVLAITITNFFATVPVPVVVTSTTANQWSVRYSGTQYMTVDVSSAGLVRFSATGTTPVFSFGGAADAAQLVRIVGGFTGAKIGLRVAPSLVPPINTTAECFYASGDYTLAGGTSAWLSTARFDGFTHAGAATTVTTAATVYITTPPTAGTNNYSLWVETGSSLLAQTIVKSAEALAFAVGPNGLTTPLFQVDASTASAVAGVKLTGAATGGTVALAVIDSGSNASLSLAAKGTGTISLLSMTTASIAGNTPLVADTTGGTSVYLQLKNTGGSAYVGSTNNQLKLYYAGAATLGATLDSSGLVLNTLPLSGLTTLAGTGAVSGFTTGTFSSFLDAASYKVGGTAGASGTGTVISAITVVNGIVTAITVA